MEKYGFVYIWRDRKHNRYYIGAHWGHEDDGYICSSKWMKQAYKIRPEDFKRRILERVYSSKKDTFIAEERWLQFIKPEELRKRYYNFFRFVNAYWCDKEKHLIAIEKTSQANTGRKWNHTEEARKRISEGRKGIVFTEEHRRNLAKAKIGKGGSPGKRSEEFRLRMKEASKNNMNASKKYEIEYLNGEKCIVDNLDRYARDNNIPRNSLRNPMVRGTRVPKYGIFAIIRV